MINGSTIFEIHRIPTEIINIIFGLTGNKDQWRLLQVSLAYNKIVQSYYFGFSALWQKQFSLCVIKKNNFFKKEEQFGAVPIIIIATHGTDYDFLVDTIIELCSKATLNIKSIKVQYSSRIWDIVIMKRWSILVKNPIKNYI